MKRCVTLGLAFAGLFVSVLPAREWADRSGKHRIEATAIAVKNGKVYLEKNNGQVTAVELDKLSDADLEFLKSQPAFAAGMGKPAAGTPNGDGAVAGTGRPMVTLQGVEEGKVGEVRRFTDLRWGVRSLAFSPDGKLLAVGKSDRTLMVFDIDRTTRTASYDRLEGMGQVTALAFTPDGTKLLSGGYSGRIQVWEVGLGGTLTEGSRFVGHTGQVHAMALSGDGKLVLSGGGEKARCWELASGRERFVLDGFHGDVKACFVTKSGKQGLACDGETLILIDMNEGKTVQTMKLKTCAAQAVAFSPDGTLVAVQDSNAILLWNIRTGQPLAPLQDREIQWSACFLPNSKYLLSGGSGKVNLWDVKALRKVNEFDTAGTYYVQALASSPDNRHFAAIPGSSRQALQVFRLPAEVAQ